MYGGGSVPGQGNPGGNSINYPNSPWQSSWNPTGFTNGGGGGAAAAGQTATPGPGGSGDGGAGHPVSAFAAPLISPEIPAPNTAWSNAVGPTGLYAGGGGGGGYYYAGATTGAAGPGGGGGGDPRGNPASPGVNYTGGGGGSTISGATPGQDGQSLTEGDGGKGIVIIRYAE